MTRYSCTYVVLSLSLSLSLPPSVPPSLAPSPRYIMLGEDHHVRIGGFRMSLTLSDPKRYKEIKKANKLPIKWLSLEAINTGKFTSQSDG